MSTFFKTRARFFRMNLIFVSMKSRGCTLSLRVSSSRPDEPDRTLRREPNRFAASRSRRFQVFREVLMVLPRWGWCRGPSVARAWQPPALQASGLGRATDSDHAALMVWGDLGSAAHRRSDGYGLAAWRLRG
jgi:hypothetical protein